MWDQPADNGLYPSTLTNYLSPVIKRLGNAKPTYPAAASTANFVKEVLKLDNSVYYASSAVLTIAGKKWPQKWMVGAKITNGDATHTAIPNMRFARVSTSYETAGISPSWNTRDYKKSTRSLSFYNMYTIGSLAALYQYNAYNVDDTTYVQSFNEDYTAAQIVLNTVASARTLPDNGAAYVAANVNIVLLNDEEQVCDSAHRIMLVAAKGAFAYTVQDFERDYRARPVQIVSLTNRQHVPQVIATQNIGTVAAGNANYTEMSYQQTSCFNAWPSYDGVTPLLKDSDTPPTVNTYMVTLGDAGSGILRANTSYEFTFSIFDKQYGIETNVGKPVKFLTGDDDFVSLSLKRDTTTVGVYDQQAWSAVGILQYTYFEKTDGVNVYKNNMSNFLEIRFYFRALGAYEWLPAYFIDFSKWLYYPNYRIHWACQGAIAALPGGQPGGYIDYSQLPIDQYDCVVNFKNRAFWFSPTAAIFSLKDNTFAYPPRNATPAPTGGFRGAIVHTYRGQSEQESRLIIFGQKETYIGKFTGVYGQMPVQVSPDVTASFDVDGSDFNVEAWTSVTAFSYRSAVVADGTLFWWGPQGVYMDDGVGTPKKISKNMEPDIFDLYDSSLTAEIHCIYDEKTKDIVWFYPPKDANTITYALTYDIENGQFFIDRFKCKIDWATRIDTTSSPVLTGLNSVRTIISARATSASSIQRGYFFDQLNRSGDWSPTRELLVKAVAVGATSLLRVLTFDSGLDATNFATIAVGDYIALQQFKKYTNQTTGDDLIGKVTVVNTVTPSLTIKIPDGSVFPAYTATDQRTYFPIWHRAANGDGINGIPWQMESKYWIPGGVNYWAIWRWLYMFFKYTAWLKIDNNRFNIAYRTPTGGDYITDVIEFMDNSDANFQLYHALRKEDLNNQGQAIKLRLSGSHIGEEWMLQYLEAHTDEETGNMLKQFEG